jgi:hypothetical protein
MNLKNLLKRLTAMLAMLSVPVILATLAIPRLVVGLHREQALATLNAADAGKKMPPAIYLAVAKTLKAAPAEDAYDVLNRAELEAYGAGGNSTILAEARDGAELSLANDPTNPRGWDLLCALRARINSYEAVRCLDAEFAVARYDWYTTENRMQLIAYEWPYLDVQLRNSAAGLILPIWHTQTWDVHNPGLRYTIYDLSTTTNGRQLLLAGLQGDPETLREVNRWIILKMMDGH